MLPPIHDKYYLYACWQILIGLTFALGGANALTLFSVLLTKVWPLNNMLPPRIKELLPVSKIFEYNYFLISTSQELIVSVIMFGIPRY